VVHEMDRVGAAIESEVMSEADLSDWVGSWLARVGRLGGLRPRRHLRLT
jgi:hypothetical protein